MHLPFHSSGPGIKRDLPSGLKDVVPLKQIHDLSGNGGPVGTPSMFVASAGRDPHSDSYCIPCGQLFSERPLKD